MDFFNIIYRCLFNEYYTSNERIDFFVFEFHKAKSKGLSFDLFKREVLNELESMRRKIRIPLDKYMLELTLRKNELEREKDFDAIEKIKEEIHSLPYKKGKGLDLYKYSNPEFMGIVPDEDLENGFRMKTKKEFKKLQKAKGVKVLPYEGVIYYADIDIIENHLNDAYNQIINEVQQTVKEPQPITKESQNLHIKIFANNGFEVWQSMFDDFGITKKSRTDVKFMYEAMKKDGLIHETVNQVNFLGWISETYGITVDKISNHSITNERISIYNNAKQLYKTSRT